MRQWDGIRDDITQAAGDGLGIAIGTAFGVEGELGRRPGLTPVAAYGGIALGHFRSSLNGSWLLIVTTTGTVESQAL